MTPDEDIVRIFREASDPFLGTAVVADELGYSTQGTAGRLDDLVERGKLGKKMIGGTAVYWLPERVC